MDRTSGWALAGAQAKAARLIKAKSGQSSPMAAACDHANPMSFKQDSATRRLSSTA
jgi:hypothetical protein